MTLQSVFVLSIELLSKYVFYRPVISRSQIMMVLSIRLLELQFFLVFDFDPLVDFFYFFFEALGHN